ncbi:hypothetical protein [Saccharothrix longispora]|uniref:hypothetical protein n=1 Tax=Saccharothrix longispora TaxID=33920 RepID=UPI0028FDA958|nr:hypothetical protein [Saccharothrix longispora]MDU0295069.1 hypothetical protein [Saccharothrix longispora]
MDVVVLENLPWGVRVHIDGGGEGVIDKTKTSSWNAGSDARPEVGEVLRVVVLDDGRLPWRLSALKKDIELARKLRR